MSKNIDGNFKVSPTHTNYEKSNLQTFINDKNDEEELLNGPINPLSEEENLVIQMIGNTEQNKPNIWINTKMTTSQLLHQTHDKKKKVVPLREQIPEEYHEFLDVFDEKKADCFPEERVWRMTFLLISLPHFLFAPLHASSFKVLLNIAQICTLMMRDLLEMRCGIQVNDSTIWKALKCSGFTMKKVCVLIFSLYFV